MSHPLPRVVGELSLTVQQLSATLALHELPSAVHEELSQLLKAQSEWCGHLSAHADRPTSPSDLSEMSSMSSPGTTTPVARSPASTPEGRHTYKGTPNSVGSEPPAAEGTAEYAEWKTKMLLRLRRYLARRLAAEQTKLAQAHKAANAAAFASKMLEADLRKVNVALVERPSIPEEPVEAPIPEAKASVPAPKPQTPDAHGHAHDDRTTTSFADALARPKCASALSASSLPTPRVLELDDGSSWAGREP